METVNFPFPWLELIEHPAFCVRNMKVVAANAAAERLFISVGAEVSQMVTAHMEAYHDFHGDCLFLTVTAAGLTHNAYVKRIPECDIFVLQSGDAHLEALALAAQQLRIPLGNLMSVSTQRLSPIEDNSIPCAGQINRALFQLLRIVSNMSDAGKKPVAAKYSTYTVDIAAVFREIMEKTAALLEESGKRIAYSGPDTSVFSLACPEILERAVYNLLSNALKFSPASSTVYTKLSRNGNALSFSVCNTTENPVKENIFWNYYRREASITDPRHGLGLGMTLVCSAASVHGGTVLIDHPEPNQIRITVTIPIQTDSSNLIRSPLFNLGDYAGGYDKGLLELSELLPAEFYRQID